MSRFWKCLDLCVTGMYYGFRVACYTVVGLVLLFPVFGFAIIMFWRPAHGVDNNRLRSVNNVKQIGIAVHNFAQTNRTLPPAYKTDTDAQCALHAKRGRARGYRPAGRAARSLALTLTLSQRERGHAS